MLLASPATGDAPTAGAVLDRSLALALTQTAADAEEALLVSLANSMVPDEARIMAALAGRGWSPLVSVEPRTGSGDARSLRNASLVGRQAGVALVALTPFYVTRLVGAGLVVVTEERAGHDEEYEILLADPSVLDAIRQARKGLIKPRVCRAGIELSALGLTLWGSRPGIGPRP